MPNETEQKDLAQRISEMPAEMQGSAINALGSFASGFLSGWEAAKADAEAANAQSA